MANAFLSQFDAVVRDDNGGTDRILNTVKLDDGRKTVRRFNFPEPVACDDTDSAALVAAARKSGGSYKRTGPCGELDSGSTRERANALSGAAAIRAVSALCGVPVVKKADSVPPAVAARSANVTNGEKVAS